ncbi:DNA glycosylase [Rhizopogon vinicolor AM-OR11-026]|uniref:DNA glycosylase n=1 Tax=Rhizopogon vinicolor AM-OR11-026 TaxID=1314800 RepID=A0A1B7NGV4_9AGAM|nr:DNA glycosylase [Rhizopogon vinicolor AM-OR11-026]
MPVTRSATRSALSTPVRGSNKTTAAASAVKSGKRKAADELTASKKAPRTKKSSNPSDETAVATPLTSVAFIPPPPSPLQNTPEKETLVPAVLTFSFEEAKAHLIRADHRFEDVFAKLRCKPFEFLEQVHPFRALVESILAQQISWLAARSINHKFIRLYYPSLPEKVADYSASKSQMDFFPTPHQVANTDVVTLKSAGLSTRKAEYVKDLATRFADGRLSTEKLLAADDETLADMLIEVRGIGRWTVDMFAIFSLRRPNILPVGDLGIQRGMLRWFLSRHSSKHPFMLSPQKLSSAEHDTTTTEKANTSTMGPPPTPAPKITADSQLTIAEIDNDKLPTFGSASQSQAQTGSTNQSSVPPVPSIPAMPEPFTPSINKTLDMDPMNTEPLPDGLSVPILKARLERKKIKGALLTPKEMEDLTASWAPYRSLGVYYMWALVEQKN